MTYSAPAALVFLRPPDDRAWTSLGERIKVTSAAKMAAKADSLSDWLPERGARRALLPIGWRRVD